MSTSIPNEHLTLMNKEARKRSRSPSRRARKNRLTQSSSSTATWIGITTHLLVWSASSSRADAFTQETTRRVLGSTVTLPTGSTSSISTSRRRGLGNLSTSSDLSAFATREATSSSGGGTSTLLNYRDDDSSTDTDDYVPQSQSSSSSHQEGSTSNSSSIWKCLIPGTSFHQLHSQRRRNDPAYAYTLHDDDLDDENSESSQQYVIDEYLESIDKRYKRLHQGEYTSHNKRHHQKHPTEPSSTTTTRNTSHTNHHNAKGFTSALSWLRNTASNDIAEEQRRQEDALFVLGLADLASTRLLQKHHLPIPESRRAKLEQQQKQRRSHTAEDAVVIDVMGTMDDTPSTTTVTTPSPSTHTNNKTSLHPFTKALAILHSLRVVSSHRYLLSTLKLTIQSKKSAKQTLVKLFGGRWAYTMTTALAGLTITYALMMTRPVVKTLFKA